MGKSRKRKEDKETKAFAGLFLIVIGFVWLRTGDISLTISLFIVLILILFAIGLFMHTKRNKKTFKNRQYGPAKVNVVSQETGEDVAKRIQNENPIMNAANICPRCGSGLAVKNGKRGKFIGCTGFPNCRYSRDYISPAPNS